jgi:hypothetical protein
MRGLLIAVFGAACTAPKSPSEGGGGGTGGGDTGGGAVDSAAPVLVGQAPASPVPAPDFAATNRDGGARDREDPLGHPTVMWFYPAAGTAG